MSLVLLLSARTGELVESKRQVEVESGWNGGAESVEGVDPTEILQLDPIPSISSLPTLILSLNLCSWNTFKLKQNSL